MGAIISMPAAFSKALGEGRALATRPPPAHSLLCNKPLRKTLRQEAMISENLPVYAGKGNEGIDFREETVEKIRAKSFALAFVKILRSVEIFQG